MNTDNQQSPGTTPPDEAQISSDAPKKRKQRKNANSTNAKAAEANEAPINAQAKQTTPQTHREAGNANGDVMPTGDASAKAIAVTTQRIKAPTPQATGNASADFGKSVINRELTRAERSIMRVITDPAYFDKSNRDKALAAGVSEARFYEIMKEPYFRDQHLGYLRSHLQAHMSAVLETSVKTAITPGRDGFADRKLLSEMTGAYVRRQQVETHATGKVLIGIVGIDPASI